MVYKHRHCNHVQKPPDLISWWILKTPKRREVKLERGHIEEAAADDSKCWIYQLILIIWMVIIAATQQAKSERCLKYTEQYSGRDSNWRVYKVDILCATPGVTVLFQMLTLQTSRNKNCQPNSLPPNPALKLSSAKGSGCRCTTGHNLTKCVAFESVFFICIWLILLELTGQGYHGNNLCREAGCAVLTEAHRLVAVIPYCQTHQMTTSLNDKK